MGGRGVRQERAIEQTLCSVERIISGTQAHKIETTFE
jgi:hypothetical protein